MLLDTATLSAWVFAALIIAFQPNTFTVPPQWRLQVERVKTRL